MLEKNPVDTVITKVREALEATYSGRCTVICREELQNGAVTEGNDKILLENQPCRISFEKNRRRLTGSYPTETVSEISQVIKLFLSPEPVIPSGAEIKVEQGGRSFHYASSGEAAVYATHQEIILGLYKGRT